jgi:hypothetical protein
MFRAIRIAILLTILAIVAGNQFLTGSRFSSWEKPLWVTIYPVLLDDDPKVSQYAGNLGVDSFQQINEFVRLQASRYGRQLETPVVIQVARPLNNVPPQLPAEDSGLKVALWSLKMRWWAWQNSGQDGLAPDDVRMFVIYQKGNSAGPMERSVGIQNGSYGVVNAVASRQMAARNRIIITHELLHILGASDKYDFRSGQPLAPEGLANPQQSPLYPQQRAEIMGARIATSAASWQRPATLKSCVIGSQTASEIGWL